MIGTQLRKQISQAQINPDEVLSFNSKYDKTNNCIKTYLKMKDGTINTIFSQPAWYAARKNKRW